MGQWTHTCSPILKARPGTAGHSPSFGGDLLYLGLGVQLCAHQGGGVVGLQRLDSDRPTTAEAGVGSSRVGAG